jgi:hypothetical protein
MWAYKEHTQSNILILLGFFGGHMIDLAIGEILLSSRSW